MERNIIKSNYEQGKPSLGAFLTMLDPSGAVILADSGYDWLFMDGEHCPFEGRDIIALRNILRSRPTALMVRVRENTMANIKLALDMGAQGVVVPQLKTPDDFRRLVSFGKYPPIGERGYSPVIVTDFWTDKTEYDELANTETLLVGQIECREAVDNIDEIVEIDGIDGLFIGPADLSWSMGFRGNASGPEVQAAIMKVIDACNAVKKPWGIPAGSYDEYRLRVQQGARMMIYGSDTRLLKAAATDAANNIKKLF